MKQAVDAIVRIFPNEDAREAVVAIVVVAALLGFAVSVKIVCQCVEHSCAVERGYVQVVDKATGQVLWVKQ